MNERIMTYYNKVDKKKAKEGGNQMNHVIGCGNTLDLIKQVQPNSIDLLVTSPPYWVKRVYNLLRAGLKKARNINNVRLSFHRY